MRPFEVVVAFQHAARMRTLLEHTPLNRHSDHPDDMELWSELTHHLRQLESMLERHYFKAMTAQLNRQFHEDFGDVDPF